MPETPLLLTRATAEGVLGEYSHDVTIEADRDFIIIYGPNGVGKTKFLESIHAACRLDGQTLEKLPFNQLRLEFEDKFELVVRQEVRDDPDEASTKSTISFHLKQSGLAAIDWTYEGSGFEGWLTEATSWRPTAAGFWEDYRDGEIASLAELRGRYGKRDTAKAAPEGLADFSRRASTLLIETQRLHTEQLIERGARTWRQARRTGNRSRIDAQASKMRELVNDAQTEHSRITQQLDRTFPNRVLAHKLVVSAQDNDIRDRYNDQNEFRSRLGRVASVALEDALSLPDRKLLPWELQLLDLYLNDADRKLSPFEQLLRKIELLEDIINKRLLNKRLQVTADEGIKVTREDGRILDLNTLSSGEQHEVILMFELLFNVPTGALVMIDEPEISLHVIWQIGFVPDVRRIADASGFRFIVATHSPQIINDSWDQAVRLGPEGAQFA